MLIPDATSGLYVLATTANRAGRRSTGIALSPYAANGVVDIQQEGQVSAASSTLAAGTASLVRVSATGSLERVASPGATDDVVGWVETDGTLHLRCGQSPGGYGYGAAGFTAPTGTGVVTVTGGALDASSLAFPLAANKVTQASGTGFPHVTAGSLDAASVTISLTAASAHVTGVLPLANGGTGNAGAAVAVSAMAIDWSLGPVFTKTLAAGANTFTFSNQASGMVIVVRVTGAASTLTWPTVKWAGGVAPTQTASGIDVYTFVHDGTSIYGSYVQAMA